MMASVNPKQPNKVKCPTCQKYVYDNSNCICCDECDYWFHLRCTKLKLKEFKALAKNPDSSYVCICCSNYKCPKCIRPVFDRQNAVCCDACKTWYHLRCSKLSLKQFIEISKTSEPWICNQCYNPPFISVDNNAFHDLVVNHDHLEQHTLNFIGTNNFSPKCPACSRNIPVNKRYTSLPCHTCKSLVHRYCCNIPLHELLNLRASDLAQWECKVCLADKFPFSDMDTHELLKNNFNSNFDCTCKTTCLTNRSSFNFKQFQYSEYLNDNENDVFGPDPYNLTDKMFDFHPEFDYFDIHDFHKLIKKQPKNQKNNFSLFHTNIQSLMHNFEYLEILLKDLEYKFDIVALSETWNPESKKTTFRPGNLEGYHDYSGTSGNTLKGGCGFFVKKDLKVIDRTDLDISFCDDTNEFQGKWIEIVNNKSSNILVGVYYRHPKKLSDKSFNTKLKESLQSLSNENKLIVFTGDFNYDLLNLNKNEYSKDFIAICFSLFYQPCIIEPTRCVNGSRPTLIDNIFINLIEKHITSGNLT